MALPSDFALPSDLAIPSFDLGSLVTNLENVDSYRVTIASADGTEYSGTVVTRPVVARDLRMGSGDSSTHIVTIGDEAWMGTGDGPLQTAPAALIAGMIPLFDPMVLLGAFGGLSMSEYADNLGEEEKNGQNTTHYKVDVSTLPNFAQLGHAGKRDDRDVGRRRRLPGVVHRHGLRDGRTEPHDRRDQRQRPGERGGAPELSPTSVVVVGGGIVGTATAYFCAREGMSVTLLERRTIGYGASGRNPGWLWLHCRTAGFALDISRAGRAMYPELLRELPGGFEFRPSGGLMYFTTPEQGAVFEEFVAARRRDGLTMELIDGAEVRRLVPPIREDVLGASYSPDDAQIVTQTVVEAFARGAARMRRGHPRGRHGRSARPRRGPGRRHGDERRPRHGRRHRHRHRHVVDRAPRPRGCRHPDRWRAAADGRHRSPARVHRAAGVRSRGDQAIRPVPRPPFVGTRPVHSRR